VVATLTYGRFWRRTLCATPVQASTVGQQAAPQQGSDWFQENGAGGAGQASPLEAVAESLQTAGAILQWVVVEAEVGT
jgi:hypothetical protein